MAPTDDQGAGGVLPVQVGTSSVLVPVLPMRRATEWVEGLWHALSATADEAEKLGADLTDERLLARLNDVTVSRALDLVIAFDIQHKLGTRDELMDKMSPGQVKRALVSMKDECVPFDEETTFLTMAAAVARSRLPRSTNGHSASGDSAPSSSENGSRSASSASSGKRARSASLRSVATE